MFHESWWLDSVAPGAWAVAEVRNGTDVIARMPYVAHRKFGLQFISMPPLTQVLGPIEANSDARYARMLARQKDTYGELLDQLPRYDLFRQSFHPEMSNWLPFYWRRFAQTTRYTYRLALKSSLDELWAGTEDRVRTDVRKAARILTVQESWDPDRFAAIVAMTFSRQGRRSPVSAELIDRIVKAATSNARVKTLSAVDSAGRTHGVALFVGDHRCVYYLVGGADPSLRNSGCHSLLIWKGVQWASEFSETFDFEGSMLEGVERFVRGFGARQVQYMQLTAMSRRMAVLWHTYALAHAVAGRKVSMFST